MAALEGVAGCRLDRYGVRRGRVGLDRLIFPDPETSVLSFDSLRALDTTRVFALKTKRGQDLEDKFVEAFPSDYLLNRVVGGARFMGSRFLLGEIKQRTLVQEVDAAAIEPGY